MTSRTNLLACYLLDNWHEQDCADRASEHTFPPTTKVGIGFIDHEGVEMRETTASVAGHTYGCDEAEEGWRHLNELLETEARRIAHALHDEVGQVLTSAHLIIKDAAREMPYSVRECLRKVEEALVMVERDLRRISHELRPTILDDLGLVPALQSLADGMGQRSGLALTVTGLIEGRLPCLVETALYRIVMEALANVIKHADATAAWVSVWQEGGFVHCNVKDNGCGFVMDSPNVPGTGLGILGMKERIASLAGHLRIDSAPGCGTHLQIKVPITEHALSLSYYPRRKV